MNRAGILRPSNRYTGPDLTPELVSTAEVSLGYTLPESLVDLLRGCNGGTPVRGYFPMETPTSWASDQIQIKAILGIGGRHDLHDAVRGHDTVMLDYSTVGPQGEPTVAYIDEDRVPQKNADSFADFISGLRDCSEFED